MKTILSEQAVCKWLGVSEYQLKNLRELGLHYYGFGREIRFYVRQEIVEWIVNNG